MLTTLLAGSLSTVNVIHLLFAIIIIALVIWVIYWLIGKIGVPQPFATIIYVVIALVILAYALNYFGYW